MMPGKRPGISYGRPMSQTLTLGHSPDPDDAFMFYGLARELIPTDGFKFQHILQDIQTLNERATRGELDISAISLHAYAYVSAHYALLPSGASMGDGYGPIVVAKEPLSRDDLTRKKIAVLAHPTAASDAAAFASAAAVQPTEDGVVGSSRRAAAA